MSYEKCLINLKLGGLINGKEIQDAAEAYRERGQDREQSLISAVEWKIAELEGDRVKVVAAVRKAYGKAAPVKVEPKLDPVKAEAVKEPVKKAAPEAPTADVAKFSRSEQNDNNEGEDDGINNRRADGTEPGRAEQDVSTTVAGEPAAEGWAGATSIRRDGRPVIVWRGSKQALAAGHFDLDSLGKASGNPSSGLGVWFTSGKGEAGTYGNAEPFHLDIRNAKILRFDKLPGFDSVEEAHAWRESLRREGFDGLALHGKGIGKMEVHFVAFDASQVIYPKKAKFSRGERTSTGLTPAQFTTELAKAFGAKVAERLQAKGVVVPLADQTQLPDHVVPFLRDGDIVYGFYDPKTNKTYAVLENLTPEMVKGLTLHEVGTHYGFKAMLGDAKYANVMQRLDVMRRAGSKAVKDAYAEAKKNAVRDSQVPEETLAYLVQNQPEMGLVREVIARIKAFLFNEFGIGGKYLTEADITMLARAAVVHSVRTEDGGSQYGASVAANFSFAGRNAATADAHALETAERRLANGVRPEQVRKDTGWFKGVDGKMRFEINDKDATLKAVALRELHAEFLTKRNDEPSTKLKDLISHPKLFSAYPQLKEMPVFVDGGRGASISHKEGWEHITLGVQVEDSLSVLLHEIQHGIQNIEGFASGANPDLAALPQIREINKSLSWVAAEKDAIREQQHARGVDPQKVKDQLRALDDRYHQLLDERANVDGFDIYRRHAGEVEARNTQTRQSFTDEERALMPAYTTQDVPDSDVIVVFNGKEMRSAPTPENALRGTNEAMTNKDVVGNQGGRSADDTSPGVRGSKLFSEDNRLSNLSPSGASWQRIRENNPVLRDKGPDDTVTVYRATIGDSIRPDDYVAADKATLRTELKNVRERDGAAAKIVSKQVRVRDLLMGNDATEFVFFPENESTAPDSGGAMFSRSQIVGQTSRHSWNSPEPSKFDDLVYRLQDKQVDTKRVIEAIRETGKALADEKDVYLQEELFHGRAAARTEDFVNKELGPLVTEMKMRGIDIPTLDEYLHARHAEEANELIAQRNPDIQDGGSGMTTKAARDYLAKLDPAERKRLEAVAAKVDAILSTTRQMYADYSLESDATVKGWGQMFKNYVPLMREDKDGGMGIGQGFSIKGKETKGRTGSTRKVVDILANIAMQRERAIVRGEKNRVSTALVGLVELNPNEDFWAVGPPPMEKVYDPKSDSVVERADPLFKSRENVIVAKVKQANGEVVEKAVRFNEDNERAMRMAAALKNLDAAQLNGVLGVSAKITRYFSAISTQYNPIFGVVNLVRDFQGAILNLSTTQLKGHGKEIAGHTLSALKGIYLDTRAARDGKTPTSAWATLWEEFQNEGGQTGYRDMFANSADRAKAIEHELNPTAWMDSPLGKVFTAGGALKVPLALAQKKATGLFGWLSDYNLAMENAVRLSAYKVGLEQGMTKQQAASLGKNLTVNFNRRGQVGQQVGAIYAFYNAATQGSARLGQTLFDMDGSDVKSIRLSATGKKIVYGGMLLGTMQALLLSAAGFDDEEPPDFVRERSLIIPTGGKSYITIPMPLGLHVIPNMGRIPTEFVLGGFRQPAKHVLKLLGLTAGAFNPIGGGASLVQMLSPTAVDPLVALAENKDWTGKPIAKTSYNKAIPGHALMKDTASGPAKVLAEAINTMTGGTKYTAGVFSPTPDQIDYLWGQATGGVGRELGKAQQTVSATMTGEDLPVHKIPLVGRFYGNADTQSAQSSKFYATINRLNEHEAEIKGLRKDHKVVELADYIKSNPDARLFERANAVEREVQKLRRIKRELVALDSPPERIKAIEARINQLMTGFNEQAARLKQAP